MIHILGLLIVAINQSVQLTPKPWKRLTSQTMMIFGPLRPNYFAAVHYVEDNAEVTIYDLSGKSIQRNRLPHQAVVGVANGHLNCAFLHRGWYAKDEDQSQPPTRLPSDWAVRHSWNLETADAGSGRYIIWTRKPLPSYDEAHHVINIHNVKAEKNSNYRKEKDYLVITWNKGKSGQILATYSYGYDPIEDPMPGIVGSMVYFPAKSTLVLLIEDGLYEIPVPKLETAPNKDIIASPSPLSAAEERKQSG